MRIARVLHASTTTPIVALERDGALYAVAELDRVWATGFAPDRLPAAGDFHTRVVALACAGLAELDDQLRAGARPSGARLLPGTFLWLAPCDTDRCLYVHVTAGVEPRYRVANARSLFGHDTAVPFPSREEHPELEVCLGAILAEDLARATATEAEKAILGYAVLGDWTARDEWRRDRERGAGDARSKDFATQLGPVLVTKDELGDRAPLRLQVRAGGEVLPSSVVADACASLSEAVAYVSESVELRAGDVVGFGPLATVAAPYGTSVDVEIERLGSLSGRAARGPEPARWRRD